MKITAPLGFKFQDDVYYEVENIIQLRKFCSDLFKEPPPEIMFETVGELTKFLKANGFTVKGSLAPKTTKREGTK